MEVWFLMYQSWHIKRWKKERKKEEEEERKKETVLAENGNFENAISPEPSGISTRSKRPEVRLVLIFSYKKAFGRGIIHGARIFTGKPGFDVFSLWRIIVQLALVGFLSLGRRPLPRPHDI